MKKTMMIGAMSLLMTIPAFAQKDVERAQNPEERAERMTARMAENLELRDDQRAAVYEANLEMVMKARENRQEAREEYQAKLADILDEEQMAKAEEMGEKRKMKMRQRGERMEEREMRREEMREERTTPDDRDQ